MFFFIKQKNMFLYIFFFILFVLIINLFFYSLITIALYKLICYESNTLNLLIDDFYYNKSSYVFYYFINFIDLKLIGIQSYNFFFYNMFVEINYIFFYCLIKNIYINSFFFNNEFFIISNKDWNLIFLNFYIRTSNLNWINAISLQKTIILNLNESGLFFFVFIILVILV